MGRFAALLAQKRRPLWMGVLNLTPDSFSDGGAGDPEGRAAALLAAGADVIDAGGESTRPGAPEVPAGEELRRVLPVVRALRRRFPDCCISVDTRKSAVAREVLAAGADAINDVSMLGDPGMASAVAAADAGLIVMHSRGTPETMRNAALCRYENLVEDVSHALENAVSSALAAGVSRAGLMVDPGIGFAKTPEGDWELLGEKALARLAKIAPVLIGHSRKSFLCKTFGIESTLEREAPTIGVSVAAALLGADMIRVHDVRSSRLAALAALCACGKFACLDLQRS